MAVLNRVSEFYDEMVEWRRDFHAHPELEFDVHRTARLIGVRYEGSVEPLVASSAS